MTIHTKPLYRFLAAFGLIATLAACGSGGGDNKDSTPDSFTFTPVTDAAVSTEVTSSAVTLAGFNQDVSISISGGSYSTGGAYTTTAGTVSSGKSVTVKVTTSASTNTPVEAVLTVGGVTSTFKVTTKADITPDTFSFTAATGITPKSVTTSTAITVAGIDIAVPISITGGEYSINDGAFTSTAGTVSKNQTVKVRGTASASTTTTSNVVLIISDKNASYTITTFADTVAPTAQILFPPPVSMTEGNTILVRGSASDDYSTVTSVKVNDVAVTPKAAGDFSTWQISVPLTASTDTNLVVTTEDSVGNKSTNAAHIMVRQGDHKNAFPNTNVLLESVYNFAIDKLDGRNRVFISDTSSSPKKIVTVDLATGERSIFAENVGADSMTIEPVTKRLYVAGSINGISATTLMYFNLADAARTEVSRLPKLDYITSVIVDDLDPLSKIVWLGNDSCKIFASNLASNDISVISDGANNIPNGDNLLIYPQSIVLDKKNSRYLVTNGGQDDDANKHAIFSVDRKTGARTIFSSNSVGTGDLFTANGGVGRTTNALYGIVLDELNGQAIINEYVDGRFYKVDLLTGNRQLFSKSDSASDVNRIRFANSIALVASNQYILVAEWSKHGIYAVDVVTGERVIFSKSASDT